MSLPLSLPSVYPRVCGGTVDPELSPVVIPGLSPRVRGNPRPRPSRNCGHRSIPACAGEPSTSRGRTARSTVYPRVCGGTTDAMPASAAAVGLSPRVRGNRADDQQRALDMRSIPACAGEPRRSRCWGPGLSPRVRGNHVQLRRGGWFRGLSPRVRGNLVPIPDVGDFVGSIPACAGEPWASSLRA